MATEFKEIITVTVPRSKQHLRKGLAETIVARLERQGVANDIGTILTSEDEAQTTVHYEYIVNYRVDAPGEHFHASKAASHSIYTDSVSEFLEVRERALGGMAAHFIGQVWKTMGQVKDGQVTEGLDMDDIHDWLGRFREVFPKIESF